MKQGFWSILRKIFLTIISIATVWPAICWITSRLTGWYLYAHYYRKPTEKAGVLTASIALKKFADYNNVIHIGIEQYGLIFQPYWFIFYHQPFCIPWSDIVSYECSLARVLSTCTLSTRLGKIRIVGQGAQIAKIGCESHFVDKTST